MQYGAHVIFRKPSKTLYMPKFDCKQLYIYLTSDSYFQCYVIFLYSNVKNIVYEKLVSNRNLRIYLIKNEN